jgi:hypothetical protein
MSEALNKMRLNKSSVKIRFSGTADAPFADVKEEVVEFLINKGYAVGNIDETGYSNSIRIMAPKE